MITRRKSWVEAAKRITAAQAVLIELSRDARQYGLPAPPPRPGICSLPCNDKRSADTIGTIDTGVPGMLVVPA
jgi:hypothetical protein